MTQLNRDTFLAAVTKATLPRKVVATPELGEGTSLTVQGLMMHERTRWELKVQTGKGADRQVNARIVRETLLLETIVNDDGSKMFRDEDRDAIGRLPATVGERLFDAARQVCGMTEQDVVELGNA